MKIGIHYIEEALDDPAYIKILRHEIIHTTIFTPIKNHINPIISVDLKEEKDHFWFEGRCKLNSHYEKVSFLDFIKIAFCTLADTVYDFFSYIFEGCSYDKILLMFEKNLLFILYYLYRYLFRA